MIQQVDKKVWCGPRPDGMYELSLLKVKTILNLEVGFFEFFHGESGQEAEDAKSVGIAYKHIAISDLTFPDDCLLDEILKFILENSGIYFHCLHGEDRTGIIRELCIAALLRSGHGSSATKSLW